jgi:hypothetical protein
MPNVGTSLAAPIAAGAFAVLRQQNPGYTVDQMLSVLQSTGTTISDTRAGHTHIAKPLIQLNAALAMGVNTESIKIENTEYPRTPIAAGDEFTFEADIIGAVRCSINNDGGHHDIPTDPHRLVATLTAQRGYIVTCFNEAEESSRYFINLNVLSAGGIDVPNTGIDVPNTGAFGAGSGQSSGIANPLTIAGISAIAIFGASFIAKRTIKSKKMRM